MGKRPETIHIVIDEVAEENWGFSGMLTDEYKTKRKSSA
ncbi:MAG: tautomerase family protein [Rhodospirillaceae bacterium]